MGRTPILVALAAASCLSLEGKDRCRSDADCLEGRSCGSDNRCFDPTDGSDAGDSTDAGIPRRCSISVCPDGYSSCSGFRVAIEIIDNTGLVGRHVSLAIDELDVAHVAYYHATNEDLLYAHRDGEGWSPIVVDETGRTGVYASLVLRDGAPMIAYRTDEPSSLARVASRGSEWTLEDVPDTAGAENLSLAIDADGAPSFSFGGLAGIRWAHRLLGPWAVETIDASAGSTDTDFLDTAMAIDALGTVHVLYTDASDRLRYARRELDAWSNGPDVVDHPAGYPSVAIDRNGILHASFLDQLELRAKYARFENEQWIVEEIETAGYGVTSIALDDGDRVHVVYKDPDQNLRYARRAAEDDWITEVIDRGADSLYTSLAIDSAGCPQIAYDALRELRFARVIPLRSE